MEDFEDIRKIEDVINKHKIEEVDSEVEDFACEEYLDGDENLLVDDVPLETDDFDVPHIPKVDITKLETYSPSVFLSDSEKTIINSCTDQELKELLLLNRKKNLQLKEMYRQVKDILIECQSNIVQNEKNICSLKKNLKKLTYPRIWKLGIPYFKTKDNFPCPRNSHVIQKANNGELLFYDMTPVKNWTEKDISRLLKGVAFYYKTSKETELRKQISDMSSGTAAKSKEPDLLERLTKELEELRNDKNESYPPLGEEKHLNWSRISSRFLSDLKYCIEDCQIFWRDFVHPDLNKGPWSKDEIEKLHFLVSKHGCQNWDAIAEELGTGRTGFIVSRHYFSKVNPPKSGGKFTAEEDRKLIHLVNKHREGNTIAWWKITRQFKGRTRGQLLYRYAYYLNLGEISREKFTEAEDILLLALVDRFGQSFATCAKYFPNRSILQLKSRFRSSLQLAVKKGAFSVKEDEMILNHVQENGKTWHLLVPVLRRRNDQIRQRYFTLMRFLETNPGAPLTEAPRRNFFGGNGEYEYNYLKFMASKFKGCTAIPTLPDIEKLLKHTPKSKPPSRTKPLQSSMDPTMLEVVRKFEETEDSSQVAKEETLFDDVEVTVDNQTLLPILSSDDLLVEYFFDSFNERFTRSFKDLHLEATTNAVSETLRTLQAELHIPTNFRENRRLDKIDVQIIEGLIEGSPITVNDEYLLKRDSLNIVRVLPPSLSTVVGMRNLLIKNQIYKNNCVKRQAASGGNCKNENREEQVYWCINNHLSSQPLYVQRELQRERQLFYWRYFSVFKFPAILSLVRPHLSLVEYVIDRDSQRQKVKTYGKRNRSNINVRSVTEGSYTEVIDDKNLGVPLDLPGASFSFPVTVSKSDLTVPVKEASQAKLSIAEKMKIRLKETLDGLTQSKPVKRPLATDSDLWSDDFLDVRRSNQREQTPLEEEHVTAENSLMAVVKQETNTKPKKAARLGAGSKPVQRTNQKKRSTTKGKLNKNNKTLPEDVIAEENLKTEKLETASVMKQVKKAKKHIHPTKARNTRSSKSKLPPPQDPSSSDDNVPTIEDLPERKRNRSDESVQTAKKVKSEVPIVKCYQRKKQSDFDSGNVDAKPMVTEQDIEDLQLLDAALLTTKTEDDEDFDSY